MTLATSVNKGDEFWCTHRRLPKPMLGVVIALTDQPGKLIGLEFKDNVKGHSCDGRGANGHCLWVAPEHILTPVEFKEREETLSVARAMKYKEFDKIEIK